MLSCDDIIAARGRLGDGIVETGCPRSLGLGLYRAACVASTYHVTHRSSRPRTR